MATLLHQGPYLVLPEEIVNCDDPWATWRAGEDLDVMVRAELLDDALEGRVHAAASQ